MTDTKQYITLSEVTAAPLSVVKSVKQLPDIRPQEVIIIPGYPPEAAPPLPMGTGKPRQSLADLIRVGATYHPPASPGAFVEKIQSGYYAYERREEWRTCIIAAAYAGAFGPGSVERPYFSYTQAVYRLSRQVGYNLEMIVTDPLGVTGKFAERIIKLTDDHHWQREGIIEWVSEVEASLFRNFDPALPGRAVYRP